jgi:hypothetical protein
MSVNVARPSGLLVPFEPPDLTIDKAIERGWMLREDGLLMEPKPDEYLPTYPLVWPWADEHARIPWQKLYDFEPMITGLLAL